MSPCGYLKFLPVRYVSLKVIFWQVKAGGGVGLHFGPQCLRLVGLFSNPTLLLICPWETSESLLLVLHKTKKQTGREREHEGRCERWKTETGDIAVILCKGVAQDNRLSSEWRTQKGLRLIAGCDKERGEEIKPSRQNYVSQRSKKTPWQLKSHGSLRESVNSRDGQWMNSTAASVSSSQGIKCQLRPHLNRRTKIAAWYF